MTNNNIKCEKSSWFNGLVSMSIVFLMAISISCKDKEKQENTMETNMNDAMNVKEDNSTVNEYVTFVNDDKNKMALDHAYTNEALLKLTDAIEARAGEVDFDIKADLDKAKQSASKITQNPFETSHADEIRKAAEILSTSLQNIQVAKFPSLSNEAEEVKTAARVIDPKILTLDQRDAVKTFFVKSADLLKKMN